MWVHFAKTFSFPTNFRHGPIKNGQSIRTGNTGHTRRGKKQNKNAIQNVLDTIIEIKTVHVGFFCAF